MSIIKTITVDGTTHDIQDSRITFTSGATNFLRQDGTWAAVSAGIGSDTLVKVNENTVSSAYPLVATSTKRADFVDGDAQELSTQPDIAINPSSRKLSITASTSTLFSTTTKNAAGFHIYDGTTSTAQPYGHLALDTQGTTTTVGKGVLQLGNSVASGTDGNAAGRIFIYGEGSNYATMIPKVASSNKSQYFPNASGEFVVHANGSATGSSVNPVYIASDGTATAANIYTSGNYKNFVPYASASGIMEIGRCIDFHQITATTDYDYRFLVSAASTETYDAGANLRLYKPSSVTGGFSIEMPIIGKSGAVSVGNYTTSIPGAAGQNGQIMFVLE